MFPSQYDPVDSVAQSSELQQVLQSFALTLVARKLELSQILAKSHVNEKVISDFVASAHCIGQFKAAICTMKWE
jgi:hypothetical protein